MQQARCDRHNAVRLSTVAKTDMAPEWFHNDPDLTAAWSLDHSITTAETAVSHCRRLNGELTKFGEEWPLRDFSANGGRGKDASWVPSAPSTVAKAALRTAQQEAKQFIRKRQAAAEQDCHGHPAPFRRWRDGDDDDDGTDSDDGAAGPGGDDGAAGPGGHGYKVAVRYGFSFFYSF